MTGSTSRTLLQSRQKDPIWFMKSPQWHRQAVLLLAACLSVSSANAESLTTWKQCSLITTEWADGDSFQIQNPKGEKHTIRLYAAGSLVSVNELTRIKPLEIPVKAALLGQSSVKTVGALTQKQSFTLKIFDDQICKESDKCRKIADLIEILSYPLSLGSRWLPNAAKPLLERELEARNERGLKTLLEALGGKPSSLTPNTGGSDEEKTPKEKCHSVWELVSTSDSSNTIKS